MNILIIDDTVEFCETLTDILSEHHNITVCYSGEDALKTINDNIDVALIDIHLPDMSGLDILTEIKENHGHIACFINSSTSYW